MKNTQHTPGPWSVSISSPDSITHHAKFGRIMAGGNIVAQCEKATPYGCGHETEANARLIAAAPDLLAALEAAVSWYEKQGAPLAIGIEWGAQSRAAIAKAEGK